MSAVKPGRRRAKGPIKIPDVEAVDCPGRDAGTHHLVNDEAATTCEFCLRPWAAIDQDIRATRRTA